MEPSIYIPAYLEREYLTGHPELTPAARKLVHDKVATQPGTFAASEHAQSLLAYANVRANLLKQLRELEAIPDDADFERRRAKLFAEARSDLYTIGKHDPACIDARLVDIQLADASFDARLNDLMRLERDAQQLLRDRCPGFDAEAPAYWSADALEDGVSAAERTVSEPLMIGWLHTLEAISQECMASARYRVAASYAQRVLRAQGYQTLAEGTLLLVYARLEDEERFFGVGVGVGAGGAGDGAGSGDEAAGVGAGKGEGAGAGVDAGHMQLEESPWFLLGRTILLYKLNRMRSARRALRDFAGRCDGGAFFLLNPTYQAPYLPVRPLPVDPWDRTHQAVWEADAIIADTPDFATWAANVDGIDDISEDFAARNGF